MRRLALPLAVALSLVATIPTSSPVHAQDVVAEAEKPFREGRDAFKKGDFAAARALFQKSYEIHPTPGALLNLALCDEELGAVATAWQRFREVTEQVPPSDDRHRVAKQHATALEPRVPKLRIELAPGAPAGTSVRRDSIAIAGKNLGAELPVDPGAHAVVVTAPGHGERRYEVTLTEGEKQSITVEPGAKAADATPPPAATTAGTASTAPPTATAQPPPSPSNGMRTAGFVLGGVGVAGLVVGGITGGLTLSKTSEVEAMCPVPDRCTTEGVAIADSARTFGLVSTISFVAGAAFVGAGVVLVLTSGSGAKSEAAFVTPAVLPGGGGIAARGRF